MVKYGSDTLKDPNELHKVLVKASEDGDFAIVRTYVESLCLPIDVTHSDDGLITPLMAACCEKQLSMVKYLIIHAKANVNKYDSRGDSPLSCACNVGSLKLVKLLIKYGALLTSIDVDGETALMNAADNGHVKVVKYLLKKGAEVDVKNEVSLSLSLSMSCVLFSTNLCDVGYRMVVQH